MSRMFVPLSHEFARTKHAPLGSSARLRAGSMAELADQLGGWVGGDGKWCSSAAREGEIKEALEQRRQFLGPSFSTHYANPIVVRRGKGAVLFDDRNQVHILISALYSALVLQIPCGTCLSDAASGPHRPRQQVLKSPLSSG